MHPQSPLHPKTALRSTRSLDGGDSRSRTPSPAPSANPFAGPAAHQMASLAQMSSPIMPASSPLAPSSPALSLQDLSLNPLAASLLTTGQAATPPGIGMDASLQTATIHQPQHSAGKHRHAPYHVAGAQGGGGSVRSPEGLRGSPSGSPMGTPRPGLQSQSQSLPRLYGNNVGSPGPQGLASQLLLHQQQQQQQQQLFGRANTVNTGASPILPHNVLPLSALPLPLDTQGSPSDLDAVWAPSPDIAQCIFSVTAAYWRLYFIFECAISTSPGLYLSP